jgi:hypothetical protein
VLRWPLARARDRSFQAQLVSALRAGANGYFVDVMACDVFIKSIELMMGETISRQDRDHAGSRPNYLRDWTRLRFP